ncbi:MAG: secretin N-terminal domain-containing protein, partial [Phycisphaerales bacterium]
MIALTHADAASVAKALNEGLRAPLEEQLRQAQIRDARQRQGNNNRPNDRLQEPTVLIDAQGVPTVSAEPQTNSLVVFAGAKELDQIRGIVKQLDVSGFADMPKARIIPIKNGKPSVVAGTIRELYLNKNERVNGPRAVLVIGDDSTGALIVRADDEKFAQVKSLAETLEQQGQIGRVQPHVVRLKNIAAGRLRQTLLSTFTDTAKTQGETLAIEIDRGSNSLVIACSERLLEEIQKVITELDAAELQGVSTNPGDTTTSLAQNVTIIDVTNTSPAEMRKLLDDMGLTKPQAPERPGVVSEQVAIVPMVSRRAIAVVGSPADGRVVESLVKLLDASPVDAQQAIAVVPLKTASAKPVADMLLAMLHPGDAATEAVKTGPAQALAEQVRRLQLLRNGLDQPKDAVDLTKPIRVIPDVEANAIVLASTPGNIDALREVIKSLDTLPVGEAVVMRIFPLENASAIRVRQVIEQLFSQGENLRRLPGTKRQGLPPTATGQALAGDIAAAVDERTNTLIVAGREEAVALIELLVKDMDSDRASKWIEPLVLPLKHADAASLARKLQDVLVKGLATTPEAAGIQRQFGRLRIVKSEAAATPPAQAELGDGAKPPAPAAPPKSNVIESDLFAPLTGLAITADDQLNALIIVGSPANNAVVRALVDQLDVEAASAANSARIFPLKYAAAERVTSVLKDIFKQRQGATQDRPEDQLIISSDVRTNSLIISTSQKSFAIVEGLLKTLDGEKSNFSVGLHVITVTGADVKQLAPRIDRLMRERIQAAAQVGSVRSSLDAFSIEPEPASNLLIVACSDENLQVVNELVKALTEDAQKLAGGERVDVVQLAKARAAEMATQIQSLYVEKENSRRGTNAVSVVPNERLNALIVSGNEQDLIELRALAKKLDGAEVAQRQQIKWIELKSANAGEVVRLVENVIAGRPVGGGRGIGARQATRLQFLRDSVRTELANQKAQPPTEADVDGAIKDQVTLTPDVRTNSVWITAPEAMVTLISEMIDDIETSSAGQRRIERFRLVNSDAVKMRELLKDIFNLQQQGNALVLVPARNIPDRRTPNPDQPAAANEGLTIDGSNLTPVPDERQQLAIAVDQRTNSLIVSGTEDYLELVRKVVTELDGISANERERRVYHLRNAKAKEIETTLKAYFQGESDKARLTLGNERTGSLEKRLEEEVTVVGDDASNKLVISTSPRYMESVLKIVDELDQSPPQVMIQVLLAEVTIDAAEQWGVDFSVGPLGTELYRGASTAQGVGVATALGVPNLSVSSADFSVLIRALEMQGKLEVLSNPQVLANNNKEATIKVVDNLGVAGRTESGIGAGTVISEVDRIDAGIILKVTPSISTDGYVRMEISPEISQLSARVTQINENQTAPIITKRTVDTVVTVKDGQSVVIGGLIQTSDEERDSKVPILGDIPILGWPFRTKSTAATKTELLVILTPRVIPGQTANADDLVRDVTEQSLDKLEDPGKVSDYLERIRQDIQRAKQQHGGYLVPPVSVPVTPGSTPPA